MIALPRAIVVSVVLLAVTSAGSPAEKSAVGKEGPFRGACYCKAAGTLECTANLTERECRRQCEEALCDDWFWKERLPCWNWGYGG